MSNQMEFEKYQKIKKLGDRDITGLMNGVCHVFTKLDGTNASIWMGPDGDVQAGSRGRHLSEFGSNDNAGFLEHVLTDEVYAPRYKMLLQAHPNIRFVGEWLVSHTIKGYRDDAWRKFYVFDALVYAGDGTRKYMHYDDYKLILDEYEVEYIPCAFTVDTPTTEFLFNSMSRCDFLLDSGATLGEGMVVKRYDFFSQYNGAQQWLRIHNPGFMDSHKKAMGSPVVKVPSDIAEKVIKKYVTRGFVQKEMAKIMNRHGTTVWSKEYIGELIGLTFKELIEDHSFDIIRSFKSTPVDFNELKGLCTRQIKSEFPALF